MAVPEIIINYWSVLVSGLVSFVIGGFWYSPLLFGNIWMKSLGLTKKDIDKAKEKGMGGKYLATFVGSLLTAFVLAHIVRFVVASSFIDGVTTGFWIWFGFIVPVLFGGVLWEGKTMKFYTINIGYYLVSLCIMGGILSVWQ